MYEYEVRPVIKCIKWKILSYLYKIDKNAADCKRKRIRKKKIEKKKNYDKPSYYFGRLAF